MDDPKRPAPPSPFVGFRGRELRLPKVQDPEGTSAHPVGAAEAWGLFEPQLRKTGVTRISDVTHLDRIGILSRLSDLEGSALGFPEALLQDLPSQGQSIGGGIGAAFQFQRQFRAIRQGLGQGLHGAAGLVIQ